MTRDVGGLGELLLQQWCLELGVPCNRAIQDRAGWDYLLEFQPPGVREDSPFDLRPGLHRCLVQVKATDGRSGRCGIKLSNWRRLVTSPLPAFVLVLEFGGKPACQRAFLIHVWDSAMERVLKRLRTLSQTDPTAELHKRKMSLKWSETDELAGQDGPALFEALLAAVGDDPSDYTDRKATLLREIGYEGGRQELVTTVLAPVGWKGSVPELLADLRLGLIPSLETEGGTVWDSRFGVRPAKPEHIFHTMGRIESNTKEPVQQGELTLTAENGHEVRVDVGILVASLTEEAKSPKDLKFRLTFPHGDLISSVGSGAASIRWEWPASGESVILSDLMPLASVLAFLADEPTPIILRLEGTYLGHLEVSRVGVPNRDCKMAGLLRKAWAIARTVDAETRVRVNLSQIWDQAQALDFLFHILQKRPFGPLFRMEVDNPSDVPRGRCGIPYLITVTFADDLVSFPILAVGRGSLSPSDQGWQFTVHIEDIRVADAAFHPVDDPRDGSDLLKMAEALAINEEIVNWWSK